MKSVAVLICIGFVSLTGSPRGADAALDETSESRVFDCGYPPSEFLVGEYNTCISATRFNHETTLDLVVDIDWVNGTLESESGHVSAYTTGVAQGEVSYEDYYESCWEWLPANPLPAYAMMTGVGDVVSAEAGTFAEVAWPSPASDYAAVVSSTASAFVDFRPQDGHMRRLDKHLNLTGNYWLTGWLYKPEGESSAEQSWWGQEIGYNYAHVDWEEHWDERPQTLTAEMNVQLRCSWDTLCVRDEGACEPQQVGGCISFPPFTLVAFVKVRVTRHHGPQQVRTDTYTGLFGTTGENSQLGAAGLTKLGLFETTDVTQNGEAWEATLESTIGIPPLSDVADIQVNARSETLDSFTGDVDDDNEDGGMVCPNDVSQMAALAAGDGTPYTDPDYTPRADFDVDGNIDQDDLVAFQALYNALPDCNVNGIPDDCDIASGFSNDANENGVPDECDPLMVVRAASRHTHGARGPFDIEFTSASPIESRGPGQIVLEFNSPLLTTPTSEDIGLLVGEAQNITLNGNILTFDLVNVPDQGAFSHTGLTMTLAGLANSLGPYEGPSLCVRFLHGSGDQDMYLEWDDALQVLMLIHRHLYDFRYDLDHNGVIGYGDYYIIVDELNMYPYIIACPCGYAYCGPEE